MLMTIRTTMMIMTEYVLDKDENREKALMLLTNEVAFCINKKKN